MSPYEKFVRGVLPRVHLLETSGCAPRYLIYACKAGCPALVSGKASAEEAWKAAAKLLGYFAPRSDT